MRLRWIAVALCGTASLVSAQTLPDSLRACAAESDSARRLACYDREVARLTQPLITAHATLPSTASTVAEHSPADEFGLGEERVRKLKAQEGTAALKAVTAHVTAVSQLPYGRQRIALDNAQVWEQTEEDWGFNPHSGAAVMITRGALGGFWMASDAHQKVRVKRIR
jgi:hypothetical protein